MLLLATAIIGIRNPLKNRTVHTWMKRRPVFHRLRTGDYITRKVDARTCQNLWHHPETWAVTLTRNSIVFYTIGHGCWDSPCKNLLHSHNMRLKLMRKGFGMTLQRQLLQLYQGCCNYYPLVCLPRHQTHLPVHLTVESEIMVYVRDACHPHQVKRRRQEWSSCIQKTRICHQNTRQPLQRQPFWFSNDLFWIQRPYPSRRS